MSSLDLEQCYQLLSLEPGASADEIQAAYLRQVALKRRQGNKEDLELLKRAYIQLRDYTLEKASQEAEKLPQQRIINCLRESLKPLPSEVKIQNSQLKIIFDGLQIAKSQAPLKKIERILSQLELPNIESVKIYGMRKDKIILWKHELAIPSIKNQENPAEIVIRKAEQNTNTFAFPLAIILSFAFNFSGINWLWNVWIHEFGHATLAWFSGYRALPTLALTILTTERSLFVYFGILFLLGLLFWSGWKEQKKWSMGLAIGLALLQFYLTWLLPRDDYDMLQAFAGVGAEFYLSTFLMVCFYFRLPERLYWDFWRYIVLVIASSTFLNSFSKWHRISQGKENIPWGTFWGGQGDAGGDMDTLSAFGWGDNQIISVYTTLGDLCLLILIGVYVYFFFKYNPHLFSRFKNMITKEKY